MDASVGFLLAKLTQLVAYQADLIGNAKKELERLNADLAGFNAILVDASRKSKKDRIFQEWEGRIREAVYDIEDTIDTCVTQESARKGGKKWLDKAMAPFKVGSLAENVRSLRIDTVKPLMDDFERVKFPIADHVSDKDVRAEATKIRQQKSKQIVGFEEETNLFVERLTRESNKLEITSIIGMGGLGKTTLAWKIFEHETIEHEFPIRLWVNVSETFDMRKVLAEILPKITTDKPAVTMEDLIRQVQGHLAGKQFLIVLDDIWTVDAWKELTALLPLAADNRTGRVMITTRNKDVGKNISMQPLLAHDLRFLTNGESWELLQYQVFGKLGDVPEELQNVGQDIAKDCKGLPLSIVVIGGILNEKTSIAGDNITAKETEWNEVSTRVKSYLVQGDVLTSIISLSYDKLPYELRHCFLYLGIFPEDADIPAKELIRLWIAEGFVKKSDDDTIGLEEVARANLKNLINRNLLMVRVEKLDGEAKSCHIHDSIREVCKREGRKLNLFREIREPTLPTDLGNVRRLCIHSNAHGFFSKNPTLLKARSFIHSTECSTLAASDMQSITNAFVLLRVYNAKDMKFPSFPSKFVIKLIHLRYLTLAVAYQLDILPEVVTNLWNLQTLVVDTPSQTLELKGDVWKMRHLRHFKTHASIILKRGGENTGGKELRTLSRLSPDSCTEDVCRKAKSLITLGIQGDLRTLRDSECLRELDSLKKLKLVHHGPPATNNPVRILPDVHSFPKSLETLVLSGTRLDWSSMSTFSDISRLKVLKLKENAFEGSAWEVSGNNFGNLVWLHIYRADLEHWVDNTDHFPKLRFLEIKSCNKLKEIPSTLGKKLEVLTVEHVTPAAVNCAEEIKAEQKKRGRIVKLNIAATDRKKILTRTTCMHAGNEQVQ